MKKHERTFLVHRPDFRASLQNLKKFDDWGGAELAEVILILFQVNSRRDSICGEAQCTMWHDSVGRCCQMVSRVQCVCCHRACGKTQRTTAQDAVIKYSNTPTGEGGKQ